MGLDKRAKRKHILKLVKNYILVTIGCALLALGDVVFIGPFNLVTGGVYSVGVLMNYFFPLPAGIRFTTTEIVVWSLQIILLIVSFIFLGKKFTAKTIYATLIYPLFVTIFQFFGTGANISAQLTQAINVVNAGGEVIGVLQNDLTKTLLAGLFGGAFIGAGVAVCYLGEGSTGGVDVLCVIIAKHTPIKEGVSSFVLDATLVILGMIFIKNIPNSLIGVLSALVCAVVVQYAYVNGNGYVVANIISEKYEEINQFIQVKLDHSTTLIDVTGGYSGNKRVMIWVALKKREVNDVKAFLAITDPRAFVTFTNVTAINGEGFDPLSIPMSKKIEHSISEKEKDARNGK